MAQFEKYIHLDFMKNHWRDLITMVEDNYSDDLHEDDCLIVGACTKKSVEEIKESNPGAKRYIAYQLEPLYYDHWHSPNNIIDNMKGADEVWDYDKDNIKFLMNYGINAKYKPFLYSERLKRIKNRPDDELDIDILFYGDFSIANRLDTFNKICNPYTGVKDETLVTLWNSTDEQLDHYISRSKVILDLHTSETNKIQKQTRLFYALINGKCVVSEKSNTNNYGDLIIEVEKEQLKDRLFQVLRENKWKDHQKTVSEKFKEMSSVKTLSSIISKHYEETPNFYTDKETIHSYIEIYDRIFKRFIDKEGSILEIGVYSGGSMLVWQDYFSKMKICGIDKSNKLVPDNVFSKFNPEKIDFRIIDAYSSGASDYLSYQYPEGFDIIIDDGPHDIESQIAGLDLYLQKVKKGGLYIIEDIQSFSFLHDLSEKVHSIFDPRYGTDYRISFYDHRGTNRKRYDDLMMVVQL